MYVYIYIFISIHVHSTLAHTQRFLHANILHPHPLTDFLQKQNKTAEAQNNEASPPTIIKSGAVRAQRSAAPPSASFVNMTPIAAPSSPSSKLSPAGLFPILCIPFTLVCRQYLHVL